MTSPLQRAAICLPLLCFSTVNSASNMATDQLFKYSLQDRILELIDTTTRYYYCSDIANTDHGVDLNLMLGISIMKGQLSSCSDHTRSNNNVGFGRVDNKLNTMIDKLSVKFYENNLIDLKTTRKLLDHRLWTSTRKIMRKTHSVSLPKGFNENSIVNDDLYFRNISDKCILQLISTYKISTECLGPELADGYFGYALTHQVLYFHILKKMNCNNPIVQNLLDKVIRDKCSKIFNEAMYIANDLNTLTKNKDLFIEQIVICGMQNMVEFIRPEWLSILSSKRHFDCIQQKNNNSSCDAHMTGVSLAALGVYWKFLCYKTNTHAEYFDFQNTIIV